VREPAARSGCPRGAEQTRKLRGAARVGLTGRDRALVRSAAADIGKQDRHGIARARLDAHVRRPRRETEHQHDVRLVLRDQLRQIAIDRRIARLEDVDRTPHIGECRAAALRNRERERPARIERRAGKAAEAGDENSGH
jgi:hypothetical protein